MDKLTVIMQNYLETIYELSPNNLGVRITDLATKMNVTKATANSAVKSLKDEGLINFEKYQSIYLTELGLKVALHYMDVHKTIKLFLVSSLGIDECIADIDACKIEHIINPEIVKSMKNYLEDNNKY
jgi:Mn-dependent DtxR family transcriptional regulator